MADQSDVETALASIVANALYPNGTGAASAIGTTCRVFRGYPSGPTLGADIAAGVLQVSVNATDGVKNVTRFPKRWQVVAAVPATLTVTVGPQSARFGGSCNIGQLAGVAVNGAIFPYAVQANDSPATVASNLAANMRAAGWIVEYAGTTIILPNAEIFTARVAAGAHALQEIKRQIQDFLVTLWCPSPAQRDLAAPLIDQALANSPFIPLADGSSARLIFVGSDVEDNSSNASLYKRTLRYSAEYPTTLSEIEPAMLFGIGSIDANATFIASLHG